MTSTTAAIFSLVLLWSVSGHAAGQSDRETSSVPLSGENALLAQTTKTESQGEQLLQGSQAVLGKVEAVTSDQIKVNIGEVQPRFLPLKPAQEKKFSEIKPGDNLVIVVNEQNLIVDYHPLDDPSGSHKIVRGSIADNMPIGQDRVVIKTEDGKEQSFAVRSQARSKLAAIPIGAPAVFLIDETNKISDGTFASVEAAKGAHRQPGGTGEKSNIKGANRQVDGTVVEPLHADRITIKTVDGERPFEVREIMQERLSKLRKGESVILLVDNENKVVDIAVPPASAR
jgi:hypothetical protein